MKYQFTILVLMLIATMSSAQQKPQFNQYLFNPFILNPAVSGTEDYVDLRAGYRNSFVNNSVEPNIFYLSGHSSIGRRRIFHNRSRLKKNGFHGAGGYVSNDLTGPSSRLTFNGAYSYHMKLGKDLFGSLGVMGGLQQYTLDASKISNGNTGNQIIESYKHVSPSDINAGFWLYSKRFYVGGNMIQVMKQRKYNPAINQIEQTKSTNNYFLTGAYRIPFAYDYAFTPSFMIRYANALPLTIDLNSKIKFRNLFWLGTSYRYKNPMALFAGLLIKNRIEVNYLYDFKSSGIGKSRGGVHEIVIGYRIPIMRGCGGCPAHFW